MWRSASGVAAWLALSLAAQAEPAAAFPKAVLDDFFAKPALAAPSLSPSGRYLAFIQREKGINAVVVEDLKTHARTYPQVLKDPRQSILWAIWKGEDRLAVREYARAVFADEPGAPHTALQIKALDENGKLRDVSLLPVEAALSVDRDGGNPVKLEGGGTGEVVSPLPGDPDHILFVHRTRSDVKLNLWKSDVRTGKQVLFEEGDPGVFKWELNSRGSPVIRYRIRSEEIKVEVRAPGEKEWTEVFSLRPNEDRELPEFEFMGATDDPNLVYVATKPAAARDGETRTVRTFDLRTRQLSQPVWRPLPFDLESVVFKPNSRELGAACYHEDLLVCDYADPKLQNTMNGVGRFFEDARSIQPVSASDDGKKVVLSVSGPDERLSFYLLDTDSKRVDAIGNVYPQLPPDKLGVMERFRYKARDGETIPAYLTSPGPDAKGPLPLIVMPHGGPEARDYFEFDLWGQYLATRGYLVFQPNFRGSGGYGRSWAEAGFGQWGKRMSDDVTDGVRELIRSGRADPNRICIFGASYGGYAALYAGAATPDLYKCVISMAGVTDLQKMLQWERGQGADNPRFKYWRTSIGDPDKDQAALAAASPVSYAAKYSLPVLLIHGADDKTVPIEQSRIMERALKDAHKDVRLSVYDHEGHGGFNEQDSRKMLTELETFIAQHLGMPAPSAPVTAKPAGR